MAPQVGVKYAIPRPLGGVLCSLETRSSIRPPGLRAHWPARHLLVGRWHQRMHSACHVGMQPDLFFFCCIAELAIKPCRSSRSKLRGEFGIPNTCKTGNKNTTKQQTPPNPKHNTKQKTGKCLECETRGEKRVKRPKRPNALICRTPGGSIRYPLSSSLGMMLISHSIVSIPASPSRFAI